MPEDLGPIIERIRAACIEAAVEGYEEAAANGLCAQGSWEAAIGAMQSLDVAGLIQESTGDQTSMRWPSGSRK